MIADDDHLVRTGIRTILTSAGDIEVVAEAGDGRAAVEAARRHRPDIALVDIRMPVLDGLVALVELRRLNPAPKVIMLTTFAVDDYVDRALRGGASGFVLKDSTPEELIGAVRSVADDHAYLSPKVTRRVVDGFAAASPDPDATRLVAGLTAAERDILALLAEGLRNSTIAERTHMTEATIRTYVSRILTKLGCANRVQAAILAHRTGLLTPDDTGR